MYAVQLSNIGLFPLTQAERCVACGLCLPKCPTYLKTRDENESPRGRIALMLAFARGQLPISAALEKHLALCLNCRACENACPSGVRYGELIDASRAIIETNRRSPTRRRWLRALALRWLLVKPRLLRTTGRLLRFYQRSGIRRVMRSTGILRLTGFLDLDTALPRLGAVTKLKSMYATDGKKRGTVTLFTGCIAEIVDRQTPLSAIALLNRLGYDVRVPEGQVCCGALHRHEGEPGIASELMNANLKVFKSQPTDHIVSCVSACSATLAEYASHSSDELSARDFSARVQDITQFLADIEWPRDIRFRPLYKRIAVHDPCALSNVLCQQDKPYALLRKIPGVEILPLPDNHLCCGAAGAYHLTQPEMAAAIRRDKLERIQQLQPNILVTSNVGCAMYLSAGIEESGLDIEVVHPVVVLNKQLKVSGNKY